jgi:glycine dehydrogenase subunit 1
LTTNWLPNDSPETIKRMNEKIGISSWRDLFSAIPKGVLLKRTLNIGEKKGLNPLEIEKRFEKTIRKNLHIPLDSIFSGGPICPHYTHPVTEYIVSRGEFLTAYTPYQPEINQGLLQAIYEYQSMMAILYGVEVVNAGMYDGATALAEAALMGIRIKKRGKILIPETLFPSYKSVLKTYLQGPEARVVEYSDNKNDGSLGEDFYIKLKEEKPDAVVIDNPSCMGAIRRNLSEAIDEIKKTDSLSIVLSDPTSLGVLRPPGDFGADIVVGEGQSLGLPLYHGGALLGILGVRWDRQLVKNLPGRLIGKTVDIDGKEGYTMILQTREQHIRREKATSNITTNTTLNAIAAAVNLAIYGEKGFRTLSRKILANTLYLKDKLNITNAGVVYPKAVSFKRIAYTLPADIDAIYRYILYNKKLSPYTHLRDTTVISCVTEVHEKGDIDNLVKSLDEAVKNV